jgi:hypothetical protein
LNNDGLSLIAEEDDRIPRAKKRIVSFVDIDLPHDLIDGQERVLDIPPVIMPPTFAKRFEYEEQLQVWKDVLEVCREAAEFVFLGYSLPPDDYLTRAAIRSARRARTPREIRCLIVNLDFDAVSRTFRSVFTKELSAEKNHLEWTFGCDKPELAEMIEKKLKAATIIHKASGARAAAGRPASAQIRSESSGAAVDSAR